MKHRPAHALRVCSAYLALPIVLAACVAHTPAPVSERSLVHGTTPDIYTVQKYDTLYSVAWRYELDPDQLAVWNRIEPPYVITTGQRIVLNGTVPLPPPVVPVTPPQRVEPPPTSPPGKPEAPAAVAKGPAPPNTEPAAAAEAAASAEPAVASAEPVGRKQPITSPPPKTAQATVKRPVDSPSAGPPAKPAAAKPTPPPSAPQKVPSSGAASAWRWPVSARPSRGFGGGSKGHDYSLPQGTAIRAATPGPVVYAGPGLGGFRHLVIVKASDRHLVAYGVNVRPNMKEGDTVRVGDVVAHAGSGGTGGQFHFEIKERVNDGSMKSVDPDRYITR